MEKCKCEWCNNVPNPSGKGYCRKHYDQVRKYGHILQTRCRTNKNRITIRGDIAEIEITDTSDNYKATAIVDADDFDIVSRHRWTLNDNGYVRTFIGTKPHYLHRMICDYTGKLTVDHINQDKLDNRRDNLRIVSQSINNYNKIKSKGYSFVGRGLKKPYAAKLVQKDGTRKIKYFSTAKEAHEAYLASKRLCGISPV